MTKKIRIAEDFSITPGARYKSDGDYPGEEFFKKLLEPMFKSLSSEEKLVIDLDRTDGYATSFLDEAFGGLARKYGKENVLKKIIFISEEEPSLIDEIKSYMHG